MSSYVNAGGVLLSTDTFTRPDNTTAYTALDLVANHATASSVVPMQFTVGLIPGDGGVIRKARLSKTGTNTGVFRLHLFNASPVVTNGDNGAFLPNKVANYLGALYITVDKALSDGAVGTGAPVTGSEISFVLPAGQTVLYGLLEAVVATTPIAQEVFTLTLEVLTG